MGSRTEMNRVILQWPRRVKQFVVLLADTGMSLAATWLAFSLRLDMLHRPYGDQWKVYALGVVLAIPLFIRFGLYRAIFRYTGLAAMVATTQAVALYALILSAVLMAAQWTMVPRSLGLLQPLIFLTLVAASRALARFWLNAVAPDPGRPTGRLLVYGAGHTGVQVATGLGGRSAYKLVGFVDDDPLKIGRSINGVTVLSRSQVADAVARLGVTDIVLALPHAGRQRRNEILESLRHLPVHIRTLPAMADLASGKVTVQDFQELDIEDLLGREPVDPDAALLERFIRGRTVLVSGAGGSIGSELCRQIVAQGPSRLLLLEHSEFALYAIHQELQARVAALASSVTLVPLLVNITQAGRVDAIFEAFRPDTVYHAAAYKHVPLVEENAGEGVLNNVVGTRVLAEAAQRHGTQRFILISTDKAVRPTNIMGASKRMAELVLQALAATRAPGGTCFAMVRFGNVLGSSGSVVPLFRKQLAAGGPLTVTHPDVTRYFMTIPEAAQLVLQAGAMADGGEVFVLDMGQPVRIVDLARRMIKLAGLQVRDAEHPQGDVEIAITGLRPGEKLYEELLIGDDPQPTPHPRIMMAREAWLTWDRLGPALERLEQAARSNDVVALRAMLAECVSGYQPDPQLVDHLALARGGDAAQSA